MTRHPASSDAPVPVAAPGPTDATRPVGAPAPQAVVSARIAVLASGGGTNLQAILDACDRGDLNAKVVAVISDHGDAFALSRARNAGVPFVVHHPRRAGVDRRVWDRELAAIAKTAGAELVVLAGFLRILTSDFLSQFPDRVINLHPARPGELAGLRAIERAYEEFQQGARHRSGVMVHLVPDEGVDSGPVLGTIDVLMCRDDRLEDFAARMHQAEHDLLVSTLQQFVSDHFRTPPVPRKASAKTPAPRKPPQISTTKPTRKPASESATKPATKPASKQPEKDV